jgi:DNA-binding NarL/FixJ family response regulator
MRAALFEIQPVSLNKIAAESIFYALSSLRSLLQEHVTKDYLGPTWRQGIHRKPQKKGDRVICPPYESLMSPKKLLQSEKGQRIRLQVEELPDLTDMCRTLELSAFQATIVQLIEFGFTFTEIATHLGVEPNTIHQHSHKIRKKLSRHRGR